MIYKNKTILDEAQAQLSSHHGSFSFPLELLENPWIQVTVLPVELSFTLYISGHKHNVLYSVWQFSTVEEDVGLTTLL